MRAVIFHNGKLSVQEVDEPKPQSGEVLVEVIRAGICGSDKAAVFRYEPTNQLSHKLFGRDWIDTSSPVVLGHEFLCRVVSYGPDTKGTVPVGTRVVGIPHLMHRGAPISVGFAGPETPGGFAEKLLMDEKYLIPVPDGVSDNLAALTEPATIALRGVEHMEPQPNDVALVLGCGPIGLATIAVLKAKGTSPIIASECSAGRRELAKQLGADVVIDASTDKPFDALKQAAATDDTAAMAPPTFGFGQLPLRPVLAFECSGWPGSVEDLIEGLPPSARIGVLGINEQGDHLELTIAVMKELQLRFSNFYTENQFERTMKMIDNGILQVEPIVTKVISLDQVPDMFQELEHNPQDGKVLIDPSL